MAYQRYKMIWLLCHRRLLLHWAPNVWLNANPEYVYWYYQVDNAGDKSGREHLMLMVYINKPRGMPYRGPFTAACGNLNKSYLSWI